MNSSASSNDSTRPRRTCPAVLYGMLLLCRRPAQLFRLRWRDVHLPLKRAGRARADGMIRFGACKSGCETTLPIPYGSQKHRLLLHCRELWQRVYSLRAKRVNPPPDEFVFCTRHGAARHGHGWSTSAYDQELARQCERLGIEDFRSYDARHSLIAWLQATPGVSPAAIQALAGWMRITTQEAYGARSRNDGIPALSATERMIKLPKGTGVGMEDAQTPESGMEIELAGLFDVVDM